MIATETRGPVELLVLNRSQQRNALVPELIDAVADALRRLAASGRPIVITGAGPAFCVGADLK